MVVSGGNGVALLQGVGVRREIILAAQESPNLGERGENAGSPHLLLPPPDQPLACFHRREIFRGRDYTGTFTGAPFTQ
jgi:hypothetical protein